jgi:hypothetical protein
MGAAWVPTVRHRRTVNASVACAALLVPIGGTAWTECAWVLWQREVIDKREIGWNPREAFKTADECKSRESKADTRYNPDTKKLELIPSGHTICVPDTIEPRGPKGSGR